MHCFVYKSSKKDELYVYLTQKDDFSRLPPAMLASIGTPQLIMELDLTPERKLARADTAQVLQQLVTRGFFVQMPPVKMPLPDSLH